jgi:cell division protein ZapD
MEKLLKQSQYKNITAERGFYQSSLSKERTLQLVSVEIPNEPDIFPEISAGIHRITIRFMRYTSANQKPEQELGDIKFKIAYCSL